MGGLPEFAIRVRERSGSPPVTEHYRATVGPASAITIYRHRRRHIHCAGMGVPILKMTASPRRSFRVPARAYPRNGHAVGDADVEARSTSVRPHQRERSSSPPVTERYRATVSQSVLLNQALWGPAGEKKKVPGRGGPAKRKKKRTSKSRSFYRAAAAASWPRRRTSR